MNFGFLNLFNRKQAVKTVNTPVTLPYSNSIGGLRNALNGINNYFQDEDGTPINTLNTLYLARKYAVIDSTVTSIIRVLQRNVIGHTGFTLQSKISAFDDSTNQKINYEIEKEWYDFTSAPNFDISGRYDIVDFLNLALSNYVIEGEIVIRLYRTGKYGIQLQLLNYDSIDTNMNSTNIFNGVEIDGYTKPVAYWIKGFNSNTQRIPAEEIIHVFFNPDSSAFRGISTLTPAINTLKDINKYRKSEINAAINEATSVLTYESDKDYGKAYEGSTTAEDLALLKPGSNSGSSSENLAKNTLKAAENSAIQVGSMVIEALPPGVRLNQLSSNHPNAYSPEFQKSFFKDLTSSVGLSYITIKHDLDGATYSGGRQTAMGDRPTYFEYRRILVKNILDRIYKIWLPSIIKKHEILLNDNSYEDYFKYQFNGLAFEYINPVDETNAQVTAYQNGFISLTDILAKTGIDFDDHLDTLELEQAKIKKRGLTLGQVLPLKTKNSETNTKEDLNTDTKEMDE